jgi:hypothetical protein
MKTTFLKVSRAIDLLDDKPIQDLPLVIYQIISIEAKNVFPF